MIAKRFPKFRDTRGDRALDHAQTRPDGIEQLLLSHHLPGVEQLLLQKLLRLQLELDRLPFDAKLEPRFVVRDPAKLQTRRNTDSIRNTRP